MPRNWSFVRAACVIACSGGFVIANGMGRPANAESTPVIADYNVFAGGMHVLSSSLEINLDDRSYGARIAAQLAGMPGWFVEWAAEARTGGAIESGRLDPMRYEMDRVRRGESQKTTLEFGREGGIDVTFDPVRNDSVDLVPDQLLLGSLDPLSGLLSVIHTVTEGGECEATIPVFDGRRRYDLVFTDQGMVELDRSRRSSFSGAARRCRMQLQPVAGAFQDDDDDDDGRSSFWSTDPEQEPRRRLDIWLAQPLAGGPTLPVKMIGRSSLGAVVVHLNGVAIPSSTAAADVPAGCAVAATC